MWKNNKSMVSAEGLVEESFDELIETKQKTQQFDSKLFLAKHSKLHHLIYF
jgi:hypothetical protein